MKRILLCLVIFSIAFSSFSQLVLNEKKYPSLLWEISGKGMKKPSFLIGTMHVSSKMAFNLPDSFYYAVRNASVVALETNPESWQDDMSKFDLNGMGSLNNSAEKFLRESSLKIDKYEKKIKLGLFSNPSAINNLLYRSYGGQSTDFEEDTYLDMYIYQCGKKWGKKVAGVESYAESMRLMKEAYQDATKDQYSKERSYTDFDQDYSPDKLQEAYRSGNLDLLDTINKYNSVSALFDEKFLYKRNEIQANSIDSIIKSGSTLFVGVGAAHLPGDRGVIEILRSKGYKLRPVKMGTRSSGQKEIVDKIRVPVVFQTVTADDGFYKVSIPGKLYQFGENPIFNQVQLADMANGSYYMVTRITTNAWLWGHTEEQVYKKIDSLLYENVPGKIITKLPITKNGYKGMDITNRTRRGDMQRYQVFVTPMEILFFKMSGNGNYVSLGDEAKKFFGSIELKDLKAEPTASAWKKFTPDFGGFSVNLPHQPFVLDQGNWIFDAADKNSATQYRMMRTDIHNYNFAGNDSLDLALMNESFLTSAFIDTQLSSKQLTVNGYPAMDVSFRNKDGSNLKVRYLLQGPHYYTLIAKGKTISPVMDNFFNSFEIKPFVYSVPESKVDTSLYFTVKTPVYPKQEKEKFDFGEAAAYGYGDEEPLTEKGKLLEGVFRHKEVLSDSTGEKLEVSFYKWNRYEQAKDSSDLERRLTLFDTTDSKWIIRDSSKKIITNNTIVWEKIFSQPGSSRLIKDKQIYRNGLLWTLQSELDTLSAQSVFIKKYYESFTPADTLEAVDPFQKKSSLFFADYLSADTVLHKLAKQNIWTVKLDSTDLTQLKGIIKGLSWKEKKYLETKGEFIQKLGSISSKATTDFAKELYLSLSDTIQLQYSILEQLLQQKTAYSYAAFRDIVVQDPPVLAMPTGTNDKYNDYSAYGGYSNGGNYIDGKFFDELLDTLQLTKTILPDLLPLINLSDYKTPMMELLGRMVDSNLIKAKDYELYFSKFLIEAKQELKKQVIAEKTKAIQKAEEEKDEKKMPSYLSSASTLDNGNDDLSLYAKLLMPFWDIQPSVRPVLQKMLESNDKRLKFNTLLLMAKNKKGHPDTLMNYFAKMDDYRYELYSDLKEMNMQERFPKEFNSHILLGKSLLLNEQSYDRPDSIVYLERIATSYKKNDGYVYFYKYKVKKDDLGWKLATVGLLPKDTSVFTFSEKEQLNGKGGKSVSATRMGNTTQSIDWKHYTFTSLTNSKFNEDQPIMLQLQKELKRQQVLLTESGSMFYEAGYDNENMYNYID